MVLDDGTLVPDNIRAYPHKVALQKPYEHQEYPKHVVHHGKTHHVNNPDEEDAVKAQPAPEYVETDAPPAALTHAKAAEARMAAVLAVPIAIRKENTEIPHVLGHSGHEFYGAPRNEPTPDIKRTDLPPSKDAPPTEYVEVLTDPSDLPEKPVKTLVEVPVETTTDAEASAIALDAISEEKAEEPHV